MKVAAPSLRRFLGLGAAVAAGVGLTALAAAAVGQTDLGARIPSHPIPYRQLVHPHRKPVHKSQPKAAKPAAPAPALAAPRPTVSAPAASPVAGQAPTPPPAVNAPIPSTPIPAPVPLAGPPPVVAPPPPPGRLPPARRPRPLGHPAYAEPAPAPLAPIVGPPQAGARLQRGVPIPAAELEAYVDGVVQSAMASDHIAGVAVAVVQNGQFALLKGYGAAGMSPRRAVDPSATVFRLGSLSELLTAVAVLKAMDEGRLDPNRPVNQDLPPALTIPDEGYRTPIRLRHLLSHTAGFEDRRLGRAFVADSDRLLSLSEALHQFRPRRPRPPGALFVANPYDMALAGGIAADAEGMGFDRMIETAVIDPLQLTHTSFREPYPPIAHRPEPLRHGLAYATSSGFHWSGKRLEPQPYAFGESFAPSVAASSTAADMGRLMIAMLNGGQVGGVTLYSPRVDGWLKTRLQQPAPGLPGWTYGFAERPLPSGLLALERRGVSPSFKSDLLLAPAAGLGIFVVANTDSAGPLVDRLPAALIARFYGAPAAISGASEDLSRYVGDYLSAQRTYHGLEGFVDRLTKRSRIVAAEGGRLNLLDDDRVRSFAAAAPLDDEPRFVGPDGQAMIMATRGARVIAYVPASGREAAQRVGWLHDPRTLAVLAGLAGAASLGVLGDLLGRLWVDAAETTAQAWSNRLAILAAALWLGSMGLFLAFWGELGEAGDLSLWWPNGRLIAASWCALAATAITIAMIVRLPAVLRYERRLHGWSGWRKVRHVTTLAVFLCFAAMVALWGGLEPWSS